MCFSFIWLDPAKLLHSLHVCVHVCTLACVVFSHNCSMLTTLSTAGFKAQLKPEQTLWFKYTGSFSNTVNLNRFHELNLLPGIYVGSTWRCSLPWGRTGHDAPPYKWSPGSPEPQCSCCRSSACLRSGPLWSPTGLNDWWCLDILQRIKQTRIMKMLFSFFLTKIKTIKPWYHKSTRF